MMMGDDTKANNKNPLEILADALFFYRGTKNFAKYFLFPVHFLSCDQKKFEHKNCNDGAARYCFYSKSAPVHAGNLSLHLACENMGKGVYLTKMSKNCRNKRDLIEGLYI